MSPGGVRLSRRAVVAAGLAVAAGGAPPRSWSTTLLPGRTRLHRLLGLNGPDGTVPDVAPGPVEEGRLGSAMGGAVWRIAYPPGRPRPPACPPCWSCTRPGAPRAGCSTGSRCRSSWPRAGCRSRWRPWTGDRTPTGTPGPTAPMPAAGCSRGCCRCCATAACRSSRRRCWAGRWAAPAP
ncbi:MAG: hypothetical protein R2734_10845 [Nocardioides sp.]